MKILNTARETFLFKDGIPYVKKERNDRFDVPMGAWDGAEVSELCGIYILERLTNSEGPFEKSTVRLYRDDGLGVARGTDRTRNKIREQIEKIFHELGFKIETVINKIEVDFLDVKLNLETYKHRPYRKPGDTPRYICYR